MTAVPDDEIIRSVCLYTVQKLDLGWLVPAARLTSSLSGRVSTRGTHRHWHSA